MVVVAVVGVGHWGKNLVRNLSAMEDVELAYVCDVRPEALQLAKQRCPQATATSDLQQILDDPRVQGVMFATPSEHHFEGTRRALSAGKHVFVEKPLALRYRDGLQLVHLARQNSVVLMVGHLLEYHPAVVKLEELIETGELGEVQYIYSNRLNLGRIRREESALWSFAPHDVAIILRLLKTMPLSVVAAGGSYIQPNIADVTVTHLLFDNGVRAHIHVSWLHPYKEQRLIVIGTRKMAEFNDVSDEKLRMYDQRVTWINGQPVPMKSSGTLVDVPKTEPLRVECEHFVRCLAEGLQPLTDGANGLRVLTVLEAAQRSIITQGQPVALPMNGVEFYGLGSD